jgi:hypothetical protein
MTLLQADIMLISVGILNPGDYIQKNEIGLPELEYQQALAFSLFTIGYTPDQIAKITNITLTDDEIADWEQAQHELEEKRFSSAPVEPECYYLFTSLGTANIFSLCRQFLASKLDPQLTDPRFRHFEHDVRTMRKPTGRHAYIELMCDYWTTTFLVIMTIRAAEQFTESDYRLQPATICRYLGVTVKRMSHYLKDGLYWPYFLQLLCHLYGPTTYYCPDDKHLLRQGITPADNRHHAYYTIRSPEQSQHAKLIILPLSNTDINSLLDKLSHCKQKLAFIRHAHEPKFPKLPAAKPGEELSSSCLNRRAKLTEKWKIQCKIWNQRITNEQLSEALRAPTKLETLIAPRVPSLLQPGFLPIDSAFHNTLSKQFGCIMPTWLTIPAQFVVGISNLHELMTHDISAPLVQITPPNRLMTIHRHQLRCIQICPLHLVFYRDIIPAKIHEFRELSPSKHAGVYHVSQDREVRLILSNIYKHFQNFATVETYNVTNPKHT